MPKPTDSLTQLVGVLHRLLRVKGVADGCVTVGQAARPGYCGVVFHLTGTDGRPYEQGVQVLLRELEIATLNGNLDVIFDPVVGDIERHFTPPAEAAVEAGGYESV